MTLRILVASCHVLALPSLEGWPPRESVTRPNRVHANALRLAPVHQEASTTELLPTPLLLLHGERALTMVNTFQLTRSAKLPWHTRGVEIAEVQDGQNENSQRPLRLCVSITLFLKVQ